MILSATAPEDIITVRLSLVVGVSFKYTSTVAVPALPVFKIDVALCVIGLGITSCVVVPLTDHVPILVAKITFDVEVEGTLT